MDKGPGRLQRDSSEAHGSSVGLWRIETLGDRDPAVHNNQLSKIHFVFSFPVSLSPLPPSCFRRLFPKETTCISVLGFVLGNSNLRFKHWIFSNFILLSCWNYLDLQQRAVCYDLLLVFYSHLWVLRCIIFKNKDKCKTCIIHCIKSKGNSATEKSIIGNSYYRS